MRYDRLPLRAADGGYVAVIEAAAGSRSKCKYEPDCEAFVLHSLLPLGTSFPYSFGFVPSTLGDDGDPLDILVLLDESLPPGIVVSVRLLGILEATQRESDSGDAVRNDRILAVAEKTERYRDLHALGDVPREILERIAKFFVFYHGEKGDEFEPLRWRGAKGAAAAIAKGQRAFRHKHRAAAS